MHILIDQDITAVEFGDGSVAFEAAVASEVAGANHQVRALLADDLVFARNDAEREALEALIATRHDWLDATS